MSQHEITDEHHVNHNKEVCMMHAAAFLARLTGSTLPNCVCPVLASFVVRLNDELGSMTDGDSLRFRNLHTFAPMLVDSKSTSEVEVERALVLVHWAAQTFTPIALHRAGMSEQAARFGKLDVIDSGTAAAAARVADWAAACAAGRKDEVAWSVARAVSRAAENAEKACTRTDQAAAKAAARDAARAAALAAALIYEHHNDTVGYAFKAALEVTA